MTNIYHEIVIPTQMAPRIYSGVFWEKAFLKQEDQSFLFKDRFLKNLCFILFCSLFQKMIYIFYQSIIKRGTFIKCQLVNEKHLLKTEQICRKQNSMKTMCKPFILQVLV